MESRASCRTHQDDASPDRKDDETEDDVTDDSNGPPPRHASCVDCGAATSLALVDTGALELAWICGRCLAVRYGPDLGPGRHLEEGAP